MAEAVTATGQVYIKQVEIYLNQILNKINGTVNKDYAVAMDTDSVYIDVDTIVNKYCVGKVDQEIVTFLEKFIFDVVQPKINQQLVEYSKPFGIKDCKLYYKLECIGPAALWTAKKKYIFDILYSEGVRYKEPKMKVMGIEIVRSSTPTIVASYLREAASIILRKDEKTLHEYVKKVKVEFMGMGIKEIAFPRGVNGLKTYHSNSSIYGFKTPAATKGALLYNFHLKQRKLDMKYPLIGEGEKIKYVALKLPNPIHEDIISFPGKLPRELGLEKYVDYEVQFQKAFLKPLERILASAKWTAVPQVSMKSLFD